MYKYKTVDTTTNKGLKKAEKLQSEGWTPILCTLSGRVMLEKQS